MKRYVTEIILDLERKAKAAKPEEFKRYAMHDRLFAESARCDLGFITSLEAVKRVVNIYERFQEDPELLMQ